ncbi:unnamed protein product [Rhizophagus irregularis]|nr:unnamed protein product [Rhizophagus irregularis]
MKLQPGATHKMADKLAISKKYRFLFLGSQYIRQPVIYLKYKQARARAVPNAMIIEIVTPIDSSLPTPLLHKVAPFNQIPDIFELSTQDERRKKAQQAKRERQQREQHLAIEAAKQADIAEKKEKPHLSAPVGNISHRVLMRQAD